MSNSVDVNVLKNFIVSTLGVDKILKSDANKYDIEADKFADGDVDENDVLELDEIVNNEDLYSQFATLYVQDQEKKAEAKSEEQEKEEQTKVSNENGAGDAGM